jgi:site-specific DNA recombinase
MHFFKKPIPLDYLSKKRAKNDGKVPQYYVEESHPAIIDKDTWEAVQLEIQRRKAFFKKVGSGKLDGDNPLSGRVICGCCGGAFGRKVWNSTDERLRRIVWRCNKKYAVKGKVGCDSKHIEEVDLKTVFVNVFNAVVDERDKFIDRWIGMVAGEDVLGRIAGKRFIEVFEEKIDGFDEGLFLKTVEKIDVEEFDGIKVCLLDGSVVECDVG